MVKLLIELLGFLRTAAPLITSTLVLALLSVLLAKSIKKHTVIYYIVLAIPFVLTAVPSIAGMLGMEMMSFARVPFLGEIVRDYIHMGTFGHPLLIIIMYMGALSPRMLFVKKLMGIRKELSIISGFAVFTHTLIRITHTLPGSIKYFTDKAGYMESTKAASALGAGISSASFILGIALLVLFIPLWVTSFDAVRRKMGYLKWKKVQKWAYVLYALLFVHSMGIQIGGMLNPKGGNTQKSTAAAKAVQQQSSQNTKTITYGEKQPGLKGENAAAASANTGTRALTAPAGSGTGQIGQAVKPASGGRTPAVGFASITVSAQARRYISIVSLILIYGSYLFLRVRKAGRQVRKRSFERTQKELKVER